MIISYFCKNFLICKSYVLFSKNNKKKSINRPNLPLKHDYLPSLDDSES